MTVASHRARVTISSTLNGKLAQALTLPANGVLSFPGNASAPASPQASPSIQFPFIGSPVSDVPGIKLIIHNFGTATPLQPTLLNADGTVFNTAPFSVVEPGGTVTSLGLSNETASGKPTQSIKLALQNLVTSEASGFQVEVLAWQV